MRQVAEKLPLFALRIENNMSNKTKPYTQPLTPRTFSNSAAKRYPFLTPESSPAVRHHHAPQPPNIQAPPPRSQNPSISRFGRSTRHRQAPVRRRPPPTSLAATNPPQPRHPTGAGAATRTQPDLPTAPNQPTQPNPSSPPRPVPAGSRSRTRRRRPHPTTPALARSIPRARRSQIPTPRRGHCHRRRSRRAPRGRARAHTHAARARNASLVAPGGARAESRRHASQVRGRGP
jgi:hypothetical protein